MPIDTADSSESSLLVNRIDQQSSNPVAANRFLCEQVLEITGGCDGNRAAMKNVMDQTDQLSCVFGDKGMERFVGIEEPSPSHLRDRIGQGRRPEPAVELVVTLSEREPLGKVVA